MPPPISEANERVVPLGREKLRQLWEGLREWLGMLNSESDRFSGEAQLARTQGLTTLHSLVSRARLETNSVGVVIAAGGEVD